MSRTRLVVIGNGMAGMRVVEETLALAPELYDLVVFGAEPHGGYNRILLPEMLSGARTLDQITIHDHDWYAANGITLHSGKPVVRIDRSKRLVIAADGTTEHYDRLVLATGSLPVRLPMPGNDLPGVVTFRDARDVERIRAAVRDGARAALVIGGGPLGLEAADGLAKHGLDVSIAHLPHTLMERQLDGPAGDLLQHELESRGLKLLMQHRTVAIIGPDRVRAVRFDNDFELPVDLVVMSVGIRPNVELARQAGLYCRGGVVVNDTMQTFDPRVYAVGECVEHRGMTFGLVAPLYEQARVCANHLVHVGLARFAAVPTATRLKVPGVEVYSSGDVHEDADSEVLAYRDAARGVYRKVVLRGNRIRGSVLVGDTADGPWFFEMLCDGTDITALRENLVFGRASCAEADGTAADPSIPK